MIVFGGIGTDSVAKRYRPATNTWTDASIASAPGPRDHHAAVWTGSEMIIWGGFINDGSTPTGGRYNPASNTWRPTNVGSSPPTRMWPIGVWDGQEMIVWGGYDWLFGQYFNDGARYDPVGDSWTPTTLSGAPSPRVAQGVWTDSELLLWGGANDSSGGRYDPVDDSWRATTRVGAPQVLWGGRWSTVWTGDQMIVWGGMGPTQRGGLYCASGTPNANPVAANDSYSVPRNGRLVIGPGQGVLTNDTDANGDALSAVLLTNPLHGTLQFNANGSFTYRPTPGYSGKDSFGYRANDGLANSNRARVLITVQ
jgi:N-acetylneuraminic acid mutarotase